ncbi:BppU family phage baseplate upper protein [Clostridium perfringens]|uniref:BppU family phage baseplate upper protein n=1 Tax=Clostridium perfringens TaxID=1502 RepID=UPI0030CE0A83
MKEIYINADDYNSDSIRTIQGNNNAEEYKIYLQYDNEKIDLTGKTVNLGFLRVGSTEGDIIENLNVTNPKEGEITLKITNKISKRNGTYSCQLAILGEGDFLEHTATFTLTVENNIFSDITKAIADSKDFTYLENILDKASKLSEKLKENTSSATNANSNLESNIIEANNINSKLLENTSTATSLNSNLESNINLAKEVKDTIKDLDNKNTEATSNIGQLTDLNNKATELSNNIQQGLPLNSELIKNTESAKAANTNLVATNQEATTKNTELQASLEKTKEFINGLDGSQNIPQIRMDVTELQNGLKSNQSLAYTGSSISADNTLEGRTESMRVKGKTMYKKADGTYTDTWEEGVTLESFGEKEGNKISILSTGKNLFNVNNSKQGLLNVNTGTLFKTNTSNTSDYIKVEKGKNYIINGEGGEIRGYYGVLYDCSKRYVAQKTFSKNTPITFEQDGYFRFSYASEEDVLPATNIIFEEGTQATPYEPYKEDKKDILIKEPLKEGDYVYEDNDQVKVYRPTKQYTFTGNETIIFIKAREKTICFNVNFTNDGVDNSLNVMCNNFLVTASCYSYDVEGFFGTKKGIFCSILKSKLTTQDVEGVKAWLKANPITIVYQLAEPVVEVVENCVDIDLDTFGEKTYFNILNSLPGSLDFKVPSNIASIVQSNSKAINELYNLIDTLVLPNILQNTTDIEMLKLEKLK